MVLDEHAIYHARLFDYNGVDQIQYIIDTLKEKPTRRRAIAITPNPNTDNQKGIYPCLIYIWCIVRDWKLDLDIHFRGNDVYKKILMDILVWVWFMQRICEGLELDPWTYTHFVNTAHFYEVDQMAIWELYNKFNVADAHDRNLLIS